MNTPKHVGTRDATSASFALTGRVVWVTGASRGIGAAIALRLAEAGAHLVLQARSADDLAAVRADAEALGAEVAAVTGSVTDPSVAQAIVATAVDRWGRLDGLVNNAGISPVMVRTEALALEDWKQICEINLTGSFIVASAAGNQMLSQGSGSIVNVSSVHGSVAAPRLAAYAASKGGIDMLTRTLGVEWADRGVRVNAIAPGYVETSMTEGLRDHPKLAAGLIARIPMGRFATPGEVASTVQYLLSDAASYLTGSILTVDGGWSAQ